LKKLPETFEDEAQDILLSLSIKYITDISDHINGNSNLLDYYANLRPYFLVLKQQIEATKPKVENVTHAHGEGVSSLQESI
jgi:hypothetical protein